MTSASQTSTIYLAHATSFCGGVWAPVIKGLSDFETVAWDFAGHGNGPELGMPVDWADFGSQVIEETEPGGVGVGHSMGGAAMLMAQLADPERFRTLVLIEPIVFPGPYRRAEHALTEAAAKRKRGFESRESAAANFATREAFARWHREAIEGYVECGLVGDGAVVLACEPETEADIYRSSFAHDTWEHLEAVEIPVLVMVGADSDTISEDHARELAARFPRAGLEIVADSGHFLPMERPDLVAERVARLAAAV